MSRAPVGDAELEYELRGAGEPVVLVHHGAGVGWFEPLVQQPALADGYRLLTYHRAGYGRSSRSSEPIDFGREAADCRALMRALGIERAHVVGHSSSAMIALQLALDAPDAVGTLALLESARPAPQNERQAAFVGRVLMPALELFRAGDAAGAIDAWLGGVCGAGYRSVLEQAVPEAFAQALAGADRYFGEELPAVQRWSWRPPSSSEGGILRRMLMAAFAALALGVPASTAVAAPNDPYYALQWGPAQIRAEAAWTTSTGVGQVIAIVDSGVDLGHPDLASKLVAGATFTGCPSATNGCGNGDWRSGPTNEAPSPHGTHVAGIAAAATGNGVGIAGVARDARLMPVKVLTDEGGTFEEVAAGIRWAADNGADVINLSLGALPGVQALPLVGQIDHARRAIDYAVARGVVVVAAAGNDFASICGEPAFNPRALCVVATDRLEGRAAYSNFAVDESLNVVAGPGGAAFLTCEDDIVSTVPAGTESSCGSGGYDFYAGTSMATPHVAGAAALLTAQGRSVTAVYAALRNTARTPGTGTRGTYTPTYGWGIVDAAAAVAAP